MGLLSSRTSITSYTVEGTLPKPITETVRNALNKNVIAAIDDKPAEKAVGWTSFDTPFSPRFSGDAIMVGTDFIFSLRIDKKSIPPKVIRKYCEERARKRLEKTGQKILSKNEKKEIKERVSQELILRVPATPRTYDLVWNYEAGRLWFFSNLKGANEELETLFLKSFSLRLIRMFPYTIANRGANLTDRQKDDLFQQSPTNFME